MSQLALVDATAGHLARFRTTFAKTVKAVAVSKALVTARELWKTFSNNYDLHPAKSLVVVLTDAENHTSPNERDSDVRLASVLLDKVSVLISQRPQETG